MSNYLELVNKVIREGAAENNELTSGTWASAEAGRRLYPRIKSWVADAWKRIQMSRNEWEFMTGELTTMIYPRIKVSGGLRAAGTPTAGAVYVGEDSGFTLTVRQVLTTGSWLLGAAEGMIEFDDFDGRHLIPGEAFNELTPAADDGVFTYLGLGNYDFTEIDDSVREIQWQTFVSRSGNGSPMPVTHIPWDKWTYADYTYTTSSQTGPAMLSQDFEGKVVFYPQTLTPFSISFVFQRSPQILSAYTDTPDRIPDEYHDWIAWEALMKMALYDKNPDLYAYAKDEAKNYKNRAERNLMPLMSYRSSPFNRG